MLDRLRASPDEGSYDHVVREEMAMTVEMMTLGGAKRVLDATAVDDLRSRMRGSLLTAADDGYDAARRIWNAMIDKRPGLARRRRKPECRARGLWCQLRPPRRVESRRRSEESLSPEPEHYPRGLKGDMTCPTIHCQTIH